MGNKVIRKGAYGYIENRRVITILRTLLFFTVSVGLYLMGYYTTGSSRNLLTIVAVLGCLPACKSMVNFIIFMRAKGCSEELKKKVCGYDGKLETFYDMYFTSYRNNFPVSHMTLKGNVLCGVIEYPKCDCNEAQKHLEQMLAQEGIKNVTVKIFSQPDKYIDRLSQLIDLNTDDHKNREGIISLLYSISI